MLPTRRKAKSPKSQTLFIHFSKLPLITKRPSFLKFTPCTELVKLSPSESKQVPDRLYHCHDKMSANKNVSPKMSTQNNVKFRPFLSQLTFLNCNHLVHIIRQRYKNVSCNRKGLKFTIFLVDILVLTFLFVDICSWHSIFFYVVT